ncbi:toxin biosynthesis cytochrome P450 monooxygenase, putative [Aspergillus udagawae]|uniref:Toxin biosynthesis cytochrome P450 monooxygenase, putative n=1 Tax=Aspergillus udagawae TaxID=91492 RepID=A0ABQ1ATF5_9EURO|nr:toxin biosynthesis cytochrome P450 monooxygenase, putative [Aspergillus udagawae]GFF87769.1 toxin biosynthesis cytochrome P450 monooxygenase, putative [Aspergillus udagawae]
MLFPVETLTVVYVVGVFALVKSFYNLYLHPLQSYPGPWLAHASRWHYSYYLKIGILPQKTRQWHDRYGSCVRIAPDELSYNTAEAWEDICEHRTGERTESFEKDLTFFPPAPNGVDSITSCAVVVTSRGLSTMVDWFNFTSFDILGDLAFGESFGCLGRKVMHPWIELIFTSIKSVMDMQIIRRAPGLFTLILTVTGLRQNQDLQDQFMFCQMKARERCAKETSRPVFMTYILRATEEKGMTQEEIEANAQILIMAGSETTASALSGTLYCLLKNPRALQKLRAEIHAAFQHESDISMRALQSLEYLNAVLQESMRVYPPVPCTFPRTTPRGGAMVCGRFVPAGYIIGVNQLAAMTSAQNFARPLQFALERWLGDKQYQHDIRKAYQPFSYGPRNCLGKKLVGFSLSFFLLGFGA